MGTRGRSRTGVEATQLGGFASVPGFVSVGRVSRQRHRERPCVTSVALASKDNGSKGLGGNRAEKKGTVCSHLCLQQKRTNCWTPSVSKTPKTVGPTLEGRHQCRRCPGAVHRPRWLAGSSDRQHDVRFLPCSCSLVAPRHRICVRTAVMVVIGGGSDGRGGGGGGDSGRLVALSPDESGSERVPRNRYKYKNHVVVL